MLPSLTHAQLVALWSLPDASDPLDGRIGRGLKSQGLAHKRHGQWHLTAAGRSVQGQIGQISIRKNGALEDLRSAWDAWRSAGAATTRALSSAEEEVKALPEHVKKKLASSAKKAKARFAEEVEYQKGVSTWEGQLVEQQAFLNGLLATESILAQGGDIRNVQEMIQAQQATVDSLLVRLRRKNPSRAKRSKKHPMHVQTLLFAKTHFTHAEAVRWAKKHHYETQFEEEGAEYWRLRQRDPSHFRVLRTIPFGNRAVVGIYAVVGRQ